MSQKVLIMWTESNSFRAEAVGWTAEDSSRYVPNEPIGLTPGIKERYSYPYPLAAMANGWKLLAPPTSELENGIRQYVWYFVKD